MTQANIIPNALRLVGVLAAISLSACGGGGGASSSGGNPPPVAPAPPPPPVPPPSSPLGYTLSQLSLSSQASLIQLPPSDETITVTITDATAGQFGMGGFYTNTGLGFATYLVSSPAGGTLHLAYRPPQTLQPGVYHDTVTIGFCTNQACDGHLVTKPSTIDVTYTVLDAALPTVTLSTSTVNVSALAGDTRYVEPVVVNATVNSPAAYAFGGGGDATHNGVFQAAYSASNVSSGALTIVFKTPSTLAAGTYTDTIDMRLCLDLDCLHPVTVNPSRITVNYTISNAVPGPNGYTFELSPAIATDIAWNAARGVMYLAVPSTAAGHANSVVEFNPLDGTYGASLAAGTDPYLLEVSDDGSRLFVAEHASRSIHRLSTAPLAADLDIDVGTDDSNPSHPPFTAQNMQVAPGRPDVLAVRRYDAGRDIAIFDGAVRRADTVSAPYPELAYVQWDTDGTRLFTNKAVLAVNANGVTQTLTLPDTIIGRLGYTSGLLFSDWGDVVNVATGARTNIVLDGYPGVATLDVSAGRIYFLTMTRSNIGKFQVETYDLNTRARIAIGVLPQYTEFLSPTRLIRWGTNGLAAVSRQNRVILIRGPLIVP